MTTAMEATQTRSATKPQSALWQRLRAARHFGKKTQDQIAIAAGVSRPAIALWESVKADIRTMPSADQIMVFARECGVSPQFLLDNSADPESVYTYGSSEQIRTPVATATAEQQLDRQARAFWSAVKFAAIVEAPGLEGCFDIEVDVLGSPMRVGFLHGPHLVMLTAAHSGVSGNSTLARGIGDMLTVERSLGHPYVKHAFLWSPTTTPAPRLDRSFDIDVRTFRLIDEASAVLLSLK
jgi:transcriptional regulator with XRE-family HTH domain